MTPSRSHPWRQRRGASPNTTHEQQRNSVTRDTAAGRNPVGRRGQSPGGPGRHRGLPLSERHEGRQRLTFRQPDRHRSVTTPACLPPRRRHCGQSHNRCPEGGLTGGQRRRTEPISPDEPLSGSSVVESMVAFNLLSPISLLVAPFCPLPN